MKLGFYLPENILQKASFFKTKSEFCISQSFANENKHINISVTPCQNSHCFLTKLTGSLTVPHISAAQLESNVNTASEVF